MSTDRLHGTDAASHVFGLLGCHTQIFGLLAVHPAWQACLALASSLVTTTVTQVTHEHTTQCFEPRVNADGTLNAAWSADPCCNTASLTGQQRTTVGWPTGSTKFSTSYECLFFNFAASLFAPRTRLQARCAVRRAGLSYPCRPPRRSHPLRPPAIHSRPPPAPSLRWPTCARAQTTPRVTQPPAKAAPPSTRMSKPSLTRAAQLSSARQALGQHAALILNATRARAARAAAWCRSAVLSRWPPRGPNA